MIMGPNDPRALRLTGKQWTDAKGRKHPIMVDGLGNETQVIRGSIKDFTDPDSAFNDWMDSLASGGGFWNHGRCFDCDLPMEGNDHSKCPINMHN